MPDEIERHDAETIAYANSAYCTTYLSEGLSTAKLFLGMTRNDIRANSKGG